MFCCFWRCSEPASPWLAPSLFVRHAIGAGSPPYSPGGDDDDGDDGDGGDGGGDARDRDNSAGRDGVASLPSFKRRPDAAEPSGSTSAPRSSSKPKKPKSRRSDREAAASSRGDRTDNDDDNEDGQGRGRGERPERPLSPESAKRREANDDIDALLQKMKPKRARQHHDDADVDEMMVALLAKMTEAAKNDIDFNKNKQPAIAKLKLLPSVMGLLSRVTWYSQFLENNILEGIKLWLEPLADGSLPSLDIQRNMMETLQKMPIDTHHLRQSLVGRVIMFYTKSDRVTPDIRRMAEEMIRRWMRPILKRSSNYRDKVMEEARVDDVADLRQAKRARASDAGGGAKPSQAESLRARIPMPVAPSFSIVPVSNVPTVASVASAGGEKKPDKYRKLKATMKTIKSRK
ncbi:hypothetical protein BC831DRAFT_457339 [Entophlyctis helioformis]|nr:hypothetical protein BC831DRAFT_457339 [Entophlyctis helioformis]